MIVLAGKGHETYQLIKGVKVPFSEREIVKEEARKYGLQEGEERLANLLMNLSKQNRQEDSNRVLKDLEYRKKLYEEFGL